MHLIIISTISILGLAIHEGCIDGCILFNNYFLSSTFHDTYHCDEQGETIMPTALIANTLYRLSTWIYLRYVILKAIKQFIEVWMDELFCSKFTVIFLILEFLGSELNIYIYKILVINLGNLIFIPHSPHFLHIFSLGPRSTSNTTEKYQEKCLHTL